MLCGAVFGAGIDEEVARVQDVGELFGSATESRVDYERRARRRTCNPSMLAPSSREIATRYLLTQPALRRDRYVYSYVYCGAAMNRSAACGQAVDTICMWNFGGEPDVVCAWGRQKGGPARSPAGGGVPRAVFLLGAQAAACFRVPLPTCIAPRGHRRICGWRLAAGGRRGLALTWLAGPAARVQAYTSIYRENLGCTLVEGITEPALRGAAKQARAPIFAHAQTNPSPRAPGTAPSQLGARTPLGPRSPGRWRSATAAPAGPGGAVAGGRARPGGAGAARCGHGVPARPCGGAVRGHGGQPARHHRREGRAADPRAVRCAPREHFVLGENGRFERGGGVGAGRRALRNWVEQRVDLFKTDSSSVPTRKQPRRGVGCKLAEGCACARGCWHPLDFPPATLSHAGAIPCRPHDVRGPSRPPTGMLTAQPCCEPS